MMSAEDIRVGSILSYIDGTKHIILFIDDNKMMFLYAMNEKPHQQVGYSYFSPSFERFWKVVLF